MKKTSKEKTGVCYKHGRVMLHGDLCKECRREKATSSIEALKRLERATIDLA